MKTTLSIFLVAVISFFGWKFFFETETTLAQDEPIDLMSAAVDDNTLEHVTGVSQTNSTQSVLEDDGISMVRWHEDDVIESKIQNQDYGSYSDSLLEELIKNGDVKAMKVLALRILVSSENERGLDKISDNMKKYSELMGKAILHGDRQSLPDLPELSKEKSRFLSPQLTEEERRDALLNILSYHEFMALRGSTAAKYDEQITLFAVYKQMGLAPTGFSDAEKNIIRERGQKFYDQMEQKRMELGLGPFDNSIPVSAQKAYEMQRQRYLSIVGSLAIE